MEGGGGERVTVSGGKLKEFWGRCAVGGWGCGGWWACCAGDLIAADERLEASDYSGASTIGYQQGHLAPLASFRSMLYASEVNYLSNIIPQQGAMNDGPWGDLEDAVRLPVIKHRTCT